MDAVTESLSDKCLVGTAANILDELVVARQKVQLMRGLTETYRGFLSQASSRPQRARVAHACVQTWSCRDRLRVAIRLHRELVAI